MAKKHSSRASKHLLSCREHRRISLLAPSLQIFTCKATRNLYARIAFFSTVVLCWPFTLMREKFFSLPLLIFQSRNGSYQMTQWRNLSQTLYNSLISTFRQAAIMKAQTQRSCSNLSIISIASILFYCAGFLRIEIELSNHRKKITALEDFVDAMKVHEGSIQGTPAGRYC